MKALIWIGCFLAASLINTALGYATGMKAGYVIVYLVVCLVAKKLCVKWDEHQESKARQKKSLEQDYMVVANDQICFCRKCGDRLLEHSRFCRKCGTKIAADWPE